jgi:hypothetical protein
MSKRRKRKHKGKSRLIVFDNGYGTGGEIRPCEPIDALADRLDMPLDELRAACAGETDEEFDMVEGIRRYIASMAPVARDAAGNYLVDLEDPPNGHVAVLLHLRRRIDLYFAPVE